MRVFQTFSCFVCVCTPFLLLPRGDEKKTFLCLLHSSTAPQPQPQPPPPPPPPPPLQHTRAHLSSSSVFRPSLKSLSPSFCESFQQKKNCHIWKKHEEEAWNFLNFLIDVGTKIWQFLFPVNRTSLAPLMCQIARSERAWIIIIPCGIPLLLAPNIMGRHLRFTLKSVRIKSASFFLYSKTCCCCCWCFAKKKTTSSTQISSLTTAETQTECN